MGCCPANDLGGREGRWMRRSRRREKADLITSLLGQKPASSYQARQMWQNFCWEGTEGVGLSVAAFYNIQTQLPPLGAISQDSQPTPQAAWNLFCMRGNPTPRRCS